MITLVLVAGSLLAATVSGVIGFGGALLLLPLLVHAVGAERAVPLLTMAQVAGNGARIWAGRREIAWAPVRAFLLPAIPAAIAGAVIFSVLQPAHLVRLVGGLVACVALWQLMAPPLRAEGASARVALGGGATGLISGVAGSAGPLGAAVFLSLGLAPGAYLASEAVTALAMHLVKLLVYANTVRVSWGDVGLGLTMSAAMIAGSYLGKSLAERCPVEVFRRIAIGALLVIGIKMMITG